MYEALADLSTELMPLKEGVIANRDRWRQGWIHFLFFFTYFHIQYIHVSHRDGNHRKLGVFFPLKGSHNSFKL